MRQLSCILSWDGQMWPKRGPGEAQENKVPYTHRSERDKVQGGREGTIRGEHPGVCSARQVGT